MDNQYYSIPKETAEKLVTYLVKRPYNEVAQLLQEMDGNAKILTEKEEIPEPEPVEAE